MSGDPEGDAARDRFTQVLDRSAAQSKRLAFWWRDDDAVAATPTLERMLLLARRNDVPLALAVIPKDATDALAARLADEPRVSVLQHGWAHANHSPPDQKKMELGNQRPLADVTAELALGFERLGTLFGDKFVPALVPPWNRIADEVREARIALGLAGFSAFGAAPAGERHWINTHVDIMDWKARAPRSRSGLYADLALELERRLDKNDPEPIGVLTHHLVHQELSWQFLDEFLGLAASHPATQWPDIPALFGVRA